MATANADALAAGVHSVPCQNCRQRKIKCNKGVPACSFCVRSQLPCSYVARTGRSGLRAGYVQQLEGRLAVLESEVKTSKTNATPAATSASCHGSPRRPPSSVSESTRRSRVTNTNGIASQTTPPDCPDFIHRAALTHMCIMWFERYHAWLPLLHRPSVFTLLEESPLTNLTGLPVILRAIFVASAPDCFPESRHRQDQFDAWKEQIRCDVVCEVLNSISLGHLQALLIIAVVAFGSGELLRFWNLISLSKRISMQLGLHDLVFHYGGNFEKPSLLPPRMLNVPSTDVNLEERIRAFWLTETLDSASTVGVSWNTQVIERQVYSLSPCGEDDWSRPQGQVKLFPFGSSQAPSTFALYIQSVNAELWPVHRFHQDISDLDVPEIFARRRAECHDLYARLDEWRMVFEQTTCTSSPNSGLEANVWSLEQIDINVVLTHCIIDLAILTLYQRLVFHKTPSEPQDQPNEPDGMARCIAACEHIVSVLRGIPEHTLDHVSPQLIVCIFVAARFYLIHARVCGTSPSPKLQFLLYCLGCSAQSCVLAKRLNAVLHAADSQQSPIADGGASIPQHFWNYQYSWQDIDVALREWYES